jgi:hypothetical protein
VVTNKTVLILNKLTTNNIHKRISLHCPVKTNAKVEEKSIKEKDVEAIESEIIRRLTFGNPID